MNGTAQAPSTAQIHFHPAAVREPVAQPKRRGLLPKSVTSLPQYDLARRLGLREAELRQRAEDASDAAFTAYEECERLKKQLVSIAAVIGEASARYEAAREASVDATTALRTFKAKEARHA